MRVKLFQHLERRMWRSVLVALPVALFCSGLLPGSAVSQAAGSQVTLPPNFQMRKVVEGLELPTDMVLLPSGDILIAEKGTGLGADGTAHVRLVRQGVLMPRPVLTLSVTVLGDSGIYSIVLDPAFVVNHYFYVWYSIGSQAIDWPGQSVDRLSRFIFDPETGTADEQSETIILDGIRWSQWHNGGGVAFDPNGNLLVATGDAANNALAQNMASLNGKLLRIRPREEGGYSVPGQLHDGAQPAQAGIRAEIYASGLRNPFRIAWREEEQAFYLIDLGFGAWEEINRVEAGANYGWAVREGPCPYNVRDPDCPPAPPEFTDPVVAYPHPPEGGAGITALAFYSGDLWPEEYRGMLFFADFNSRSMSMVNLDAPKNIIPFGGEVGYLVDLEATAEGLYSLSIYEGTVYFIYYSEGGNQWPQAQLSASPQQGTAPLLVNFSAVGSSDPEGDALTYHWDFGDGSVPVTTTEPLISHSYDSDGNYEATLQVFDARGGRSEVQRVTIQVYSGAMPTIVQEIVGDAQRQRYRGGDKVRYTVVREGGTTGLDAKTPYVWSIRQHHNEHVHFITARYAGNEITLDISDDSHAAEVSIWYETELLMRTDQGQEIRVRHNLLPDIIGLDVRSFPSGASMRWNGVPQISGKPIPAIVGQRFTLEAPPVHFYNGTKNAFVRWQISSGEDPDADEIIHERSFVLSVTTEAKSYVAHYEMIGPAQVLRLPVIMHSVTAHSGIAANK